MTLTAPLARALRRWRRPVDDLLGPIPRPPWAPAGNMRDVLARQWIHGRGVEIGPLCCPLFVPRDAHVTYIDKWNEPALREQLREHPDLCRRPIVPTDVLDDGVTLRTVATESQDFVIANHFIEHVQDPIGVLRRHLDVLRPGGVLFLGVPDKRLTFDVRRPATPLEHLFRDHDEGPAWSFLDHVREYAELVEQQQGENLEARVAALAAQGEPSIHFHVWTLDDFAEFLVGLRQRLGWRFDIEALLLHRLMGEMLCVLRKP